MLSCPPTFWSLRRRAAPLSVDVRLLTRSSAAAGSPSTFEELFQYTLEPDSGEPAAVKDICPLTPIDRVAVSLANGRLFITRLVGGEASSR